MAFFAIRISLDAYTAWYNSPRAALLFWCGFAAVVALIAALLFRAFRQIGRG